MEVGAGHVGMLRWEEGGNRQVIALVDGMRMFKILNIERVPKVTCFVLACNKRVLAPSTLMIANDRQLFTRVAKCTTMPHFVAPTYSRYI